MKWNVLSHIFPAKMKESCNFSKFSITLIIQMNDGTLTKLRNVINACQKWVIVKYLLPTCNVNDNVCT